MKYLDSHTGGEATRVILEGGPDLGSGPLSERAERLRLHFDGFRRSVIEEPRGWDALVGALLCKPYDPSCETGVLFFNNVGYLGMCGHGTIGLAVTLKSIGAINQVSFDWKPRWAWWRSSFWTIIGRPFEMFAVTGIERGESQG